MQYGPHTDQPLSRAAIVIRIALYALAVTLIVLLVMPRDGASQTKQHSELQITDYRLIEHYLDQESPYIQPTLLSTITLARFYIKLIKTPGPD